MAARFNHTALQWEFDMRRLIARRPLQTSALILGAALTGALVVATPAPVHAEGWDRGGDWRRHEWREHEWREREWRERRAWREHEWWEHHRPYSLYGAPGYYVAPGYAYPPPGYLYSPPPVVYPPAAPLNFGFSFR
jgi:hypothetical protein